MAPRFYDLTKPENRAPKRMNGHAHRGNMQHGNLDPMPRMAPEDAARNILKQDPHAAIAEFERQRMGIPIPKPEPPKRELTAQQKHWIKMLLDPRWQPRGR